MADQLQCPGCETRFRVRRHDRRGDVQVACPRCGSAIALPDSPSPDRPSGPRRLPPSRTRPGETSPASGSDGPDNAPTSHRPPELPGDWQSVDYGTVFGRPAPPPPGRQPDGETPEEPTVDDDPTSGEPDRDQSTGDDKDRTETARTLLEKLEAKTASTDSTTDVSSEPDESPESLEQTDPETDGDDQTDEWVDEASIREAVDAAADGFDADARPPEPDPTDDSRADDDNRRRPSSPTRETDDSEPGVEDVPTATVHAQYETDYEIEPDVDLEADAPMALANADRIEQALMPDLEPPPGATYRIKIGARVYRGLDFDEVVSLFRCGLWIVADEIARDDREWTPVESHPIYHRIRHLIADGVTDLVAARARLVETADEQTTETDATDTDADPVDAPDRPGGETETDRSAGDSTEKTPEASGPPPPPTPEPHQTDEPQPRPGEEPESDAEAAPSNAVALVRAARATLPWTIAVVATGLAGAALTYALVSDPAPETTAPTQPAAEPTGADREDSTAPSPELVAATIDRAAAEATDAADRTPADFAEAALNTGDFAQAREIAARAHGADLDDPRRLQEIYDSATTRDPELLHQIRTLVPDVDADGLAPITEGASITLRFLNNGENRYAFKADREDWEQGWRVEVAAYQLCNLLDCEFDFPVHEPARISRDDFDELYERNETATHRRYARQRFDELIWYDEQGPDGQERAYLYGVLKEWIPSYTRWPIEHVEPWAPWLDVEHDEAILEEDFDDYLGRLNQVYEGRFIQGLRRETRGHDTRQLARQLSNLHVFDYLTTNYDRYSKVEDYAGVNAHFADGRFVPIDNSAAFQRVDLRIPLMDRRIQNVSRFSRRLIDQIRMLDPEVVNPILFPEPSEREQRRLELFWQQRDKLLDYVDDLVDEHGEAAVYAFE